MINQCNASTAGDDVHELIELAEQVVADPGSQVLLYHALINHLTAGRHDVIEAAIGSASAGKVRQALQASTRVVATHWTCRIDAQGGRALSSVFLIPLTLMISPGMARAVELKLSDPDAVARLIRDCGVIEDCTGVFVCPRLLSLEGVQAMTLSERFQMVRNLCETLDAAEAIDSPLGPALLAVPENQAVVAAYFIAGVATGRQLTRIPTYYTASTTDNIRFCRQMADRLGMQLLAQGMTVLVEACPPDLISDAIALGSYRARLNGLEISVGLGLADRDPDGWVALIAVHDDGAIRLSITDPQYPADCLTFAWELECGEDVTQTLIDLRHVLEERGISDIREVQALRTAAGPEDETLWPTLADVEHRGETLQ